MEHANITIKFARERKLRTITLRLIFLKCTQKIY